MPIYEIQCDVCGAVQDVYRSVANYNDLPDCCGGPMHRTITAPYVMADIQPYRSQVDGTMITSRSAHKKHLREHKLIEVGNETKYLKPKPMTPPPGLKETLISVVNQRS